jgi:hypothetical protein
VAGGYFQGMKWFQLSAFCLIVVVASGQDRTYLQCSTILVRSGDKLTLDLIREYDWFGPQAGLPKEKIGSIQVSTSGLSDVVTYGPFSFPFENGSLEFEATQVSIHPELVKVQKGLWVTFDELKGQHYLVIEEYAPVGKPKVELVYTPQKGRGEILREISWSKENREFVVIPDEYKNDAFAPGYAIVVDYHKTIYEVNFHDPSFQSLELTRENFSNLLPEHSFVRQKIWKGAPQK